MGLLTSLLMEHSRRQGQKEQDKISALTNLIGNEKLPDGLREWAKTALLEDKQFKQYKPTMGMILDTHDQIRKAQKEVGAPGQQGGMQQGPPQVAPMPSPMDITRRTQMVGARPEEQSAPQGPSMQALASLPQQRMNPIMPASIAPTGQEITYRGDVPVPSRPEEMREPPPPTPQAPTTLPPMPQRVTRLEPSKSWVVPPVPDKPDAGGGQPPNQFAAFRKQQRTESLEDYKARQDVLKQSRIEEEKARQEYGGMKSNAQRVVFKSPDGTLTRALQDMRHPGAYYNPATGGPMAGPMPGTEVLTESELDRDDAVEVRKQDKEEKAAAKKEKDQQEAADIDVVVDAIVKGNQPPDMSRMYGKSLKVKAALAKKYPDFDLSKAELDWNGMKRYVSTLQGPQMVKLRGATNFAVEGLDTLDAPRPPDWKKGDPDPKENDLIGRAAKTAAGSKYKRLNRAYLDAAKNGVFGQQAASDATLLDVQIAELQQELAVVYKGGNSPTDLGLNKAGEMLRSEWNDQVLRDAVNLGRTNLRIRLNSIKHTLPESVGGGANPYAPQPGASPFASPPQMPPASGATPTVAGAPAAAPTAAPKSGKIAVVSPEGVAGLIDADKWEAAQARGFKKQ